MEHLADRGPVRARGWQKVLIWLSALRLQFYPMSWIVYAVGALAAAGSAAFRQPVFWLGFAFLFFLEVATVLINEVVDEDSDRRNEFAGPFTGGSRVLVNGALSPREMRVGIGVALGLTLLGAVAVLTLGRSSVAVMALIMTLLAVLALGYTLPPLKLAYRSLGELDVGVTDSIGVLLCGFVFLGGDWRDPLPWLLSLPIMLAFIPSITLSGVPDYEADRAAGKRTLAVRFGIQGAKRVAQATAGLAALLALTWPLWGPRPDLFGPWVYLAMLHAGLLIWALQRGLKGLQGAKRIDGLMLLSLSYVLWFGVLPFAAYL